MSNTPKFTESPSTLSGISTNNEPPKQPRQPDNIQDRFDILLGGLAIGDEASKAKVIFNNPIHEEKQGDYLLCFHKDACVVIENNEVVMIWTRSSKYDTSQGIKVGDNFQKVIKTYGSNFITHQKPKTVYAIYEFPYIRSKNGHSYNDVAQLRFCVDKENVLLIAIGQSSIMQTFEDSDFREEDLANRVPSEREMALKMFENYWDNLDKRKFKEAYELFTSKQQNQMGLFENFVHGYDEMIENKLIKIVPAGEVQNNLLTVNYEIQAKDRIDGKIKVQIFSGIATLLKEGDIWKIDRLQAKLVNSFFEK